jgi:hypothetical protein
LLSKSIRSLFDFDSVFPDPPPVDVGLTAYPRQRLLGPCRNLLQLLVRIVKPPELQACLYHSREVRSPLTLEQLAKIVDG